MTVRLNRVNGALRWYEEGAKPDLCVQVTCPRCGGDTEYVTGSRPDSLELAAVLKCTECRFVGALRVTLCGQELRATAAPLVRPSHAIGANDHWRKGRGWESDRIDRQRRLPVLLEQLADA